MVYRGRRILQRSAVRAWQQSITGNLRVPGRCWVKQAAIPARPVWALLAVWAVGSGHAAAGQGARVERECVRERVKDGSRARWEGLGRACRAQSDGRVSRVCHVASSRPARRLASSTTSMLWRAGIVPGPGQ